MPDLITLNQLVQQENKVYCPPGAAREKFGYSDGDEVERYLHQVLGSASDLGSRSAELQRCIIDWPSEYHLSSDRANILRGFDLGGIGNVLELGSGCGAISRYLGELGIKVDAVEGSMARAGLGQLRCRDLDTVRVVNANYNDLVFPQQHYDLVLFIGVAEYAHRFHPESGSDREAVIYILDQARKLLSPDGLVMVAIENRLGMKYILGYHEDHYAKRFIGIHGYPDSAGIATYSAHEWQQIIEQAGYSASEFTYAFPDYKIPRVLLGDSYLENNPYSFNHLEGIFARDYTAPVRSSPTESIFWQAASGGNFVKTIANSFCILMANSPQPIARTAGFDFCHLPGPGRLPKYAVITQKLKSKDVIQKRLAAGHSGSEKNTGITHRLDDQPYLRGNLLSVDWLRSILIYVRRDEFERQLTRYYEYLGEIEGRGEPLTIDILPINIIVDDSGGFHVFDQEWEVDWEISREYLLFRSLLTFIVTNWKYLQDFLGWLELYTVYDFIDYGFRTNQLHLAPYMEPFMELEDRFQQMISANPAQQAVNRLLATTFDFSSARRDVYASCCWKEGEQGFGDERKVTLTVTPDPESQTLRFALPANVAVISSLRIDPFDIRKNENIGFYRISRIALVESAGTAIIPLWSLQDEQEIASQCDADSTFFQQVDGLKSWMSVGDFPKMTFDLGKVYSRSEDARFEVHVDIGLAESTDYILARHRYLIREQQLNRKIDGMTESMDYLFGLKQTLKDLKHDLEATRKEVVDIKESKPFRIGQKIIRAATLLKGRRG